MKKFLFSLAASSILLAANAQSGLPKNEIKVNIANIIFFASVEVGYEYFIDGNQSVGAEVLINDVYNLGLVRNRNDFDISSVQLTYNFYTSSENNGFVISPLLKFRFGEYNRGPLDPVVDTNSFIVGIGGGYKWNYSNKFVFGPHFSIGRNFNNDVNDEFDIPVEFSAGFGLGYRF